MLETARVLVWEPNSIAETKNPREILGLLEILNMGLKTANWKIINSKTESLRVTIVLGLDQFYSERARKRVI